MFQKKSCPELKKDHDTLVVMAEGVVLTKAIEGGLVGSLASKFGLPPMITGAIAGALPGIIKKIIQQRQ